MRGKEEEEEEEASLTAMSREQSFEQVGTSARLLGKAMDSNKTTVSPPSPESIWHLKAIHQQSLKSKVGTFRSLSQDQGTDATLSPATSGKYSSHARESRHRRPSETRPEARTTTPSPPKRHVVVSPPRISPTAEPPARAGFSYVPREELILSEAPNFPTARQQRSQNSRTPLTSLPKSVEQPGESGWNDSAPIVSASSPMASQSQSSPSPEVCEVPATSPARTTGCRINFVQVWILCIVALGTLGMPLGMLILSYLATPPLNISSVPVEQTRIHAAISHSRTTRTPPLPMFTTEALPTTADPWVGVRRFCRRRQSVLDNTEDVVQKDPIGLQTPIFRNLFCLFNVTRYYRGGGFDFVPHNLPFPFCPNVVYWSFGIADGVPFSRAPAFDQKFGLDRLRDTAISSGAPNVRILLAVGGYREENPQFALLGRDAGALSRFVRGAMGLVKTNHLDGLALHWREAVPGCESGTLRDASSLRATFLAVRSVFQLNGFPGLLALILPTEVDSTDTIIDRVVDLVDYVFLEVRQVTPPSHPISYTFCGVLASTIVGLIQNSPRYAGNEAKFCPLLSVAPWLVDAEPRTSGSAVPLLEHWSNASQFSSALGVGSALEMRGPPQPCQILSPALKNNDACLAVTSAANTRLVYLFHSDVTLWKIFSQGLPANSSVRCALLVDLDLDNYVVQSNGNFPVYWLIQYVYSVPERSVPNFMLNSTGTC